LSLLVGAHQLASPSFRPGIDVFSDGEDPATTQPPDA